MNSTARTRKKQKFGATSPPFIDYLKEILRRYPDGGQILKELIQNADDAGASAVVFIHDERHYGTERLWTEQLRRYQGPALYAFNDAAFTEDDWEGIQRVGRSIKQDDPTKVGRFGIGFNSVYHITDLPCIFSSKHLAMFDPQKKMFGDEEEGYRWSLEDGEDRESLLSCRDQFQPFMNIISQIISSSWEQVVREEQFFNGTLFRFPLRNEASEISDNLYESAKVTQLFDSFLADADISLLFLRNVTSITLMHIDTEGHPNTRLSVSVSDHSDFPRPYTEHECFDRKTCFKTLSRVPQQPKETTSRWLVTTCLLKPGYQPEGDGLASKLSFTPQVDAAFPVDRERSLCIGRLSCFLPLPKNESNQTGLPVHFNACFGLTDNRRFIKWLEEDQKNDDSAIWNEFLIKELFPHVYTMMVLDAIQASKNDLLPAATVYNLWPDLSITARHERWHAVARASLQHLFKFNIFHLVQDEKIWVSPSDAVIPVNNASSVVMSAVRRFLIAGGEKLIAVPEHVLESVSQIFHQREALKQVTPSLVRDVLRRSTTADLEKTDKHHLLEFILSDEKFSELKGLKLLPLSDGSFTTFSNEAKDAVLIDNETFPRSLLPFCKTHFLPNDLSPSCTMQLRKLGTKNIYNIINLDAKHVAELSRKSLPMDWKKAQGDVAWNTSDPPKTWLSEFWKFLDLNFKTLSYFLEMPLIPVEPLQSSGSVITLVRLQNNTTVIFESSVESALSNPIQSVLKKAGCSVIKRSEFLRHQELDRYVLPASPRNVLQVFMNAPRDRVIKGIESASPDQKEQMKGYLSSLTSLLDSEKSLLASLPLFRRRSGEYAAVQSKLAVFSETTPAIPKNLPMPANILQCASEAERRLLSLLSIEPMDAAKLALHLVQYIETGGLHKAAEQKIVSWILNAGSILLSQSPELLAMMKSLRFIDSTQEEPQQVSSVFDPNNATFQELFEADFFPPAFYTKTPEMLQSLKRLGLKTQEKELSTANILYVISQIHQLSVSSPVKASQKAHALIPVLNRNDFLSKLSGVQIGELKQKQWLPCENLKLFNSSRNLYKPAEMRHSKYCPVVGYVMPLTSELKGAVCNILGLHEPPPAVRVLENLKAMDKKRSQEPQFKIKLHSVYEFMHNNTESFRGLQDSRHFPWVWSGSELVVPGEIVLSHPPELDLSPYIKKVPKEFLTHKNLFVSLGVKVTVSDVEIEGVLHEIKNSIDARNPRHGNMTELKVSISILDWMRKNEKSLRECSPVPVLGPNQSFTLEPLSKTVFCDISAEGLEDLQQDNEEFYVVHEEVLPVTAKWLRVPFLSTRILKSQFTQAEQESFGIEQCGQFEPITQRIKNILKEYDEEIDLFKELLQNAEDAGASTCQFLVDFRKHRDPPESLFDTGMALCNGPCLWVFNNQLFSEEDWTNIVKVGSASKENKVDMIGKFGLGFNAVYHVSDIPSILSGNTLLILDPNVSHLEKHIVSQGNPGIKLDPYKERLNKRFPGQFKSYEGIFDCDLTARNSRKSYSGTLIKLPFRTEEEAKASKISSKVYDVERIKRFTTFLTENSVTHLLFLKSITSMSLQILSKDAPTPPTAEQVQTCLKVSREVLHSFSVSNVSLLRTTESLFRNTTCHNIVDVCKACIVKMAHENLENTVTKYWLLYSCFGTREALQMFQRRSQQEHVFSFPIGGIAVPLVREETAWSPDARLSGQAFCFLPLNIETGVPFHVNGTFAVTSNRKALWDKGVKSEWNKALLKDAVTSAYITTLLELKKMSQSGDLLNYCFYTYWPNTTTLNKAFLPMAESFYSAVTQNGQGEPLELFSNGLSWCSIDEVKFLNPAIEENRAVGNIALKVILGLGASHSDIVPLPSWVKQSFFQCGFKSTIEQRTINWPEFYDIIFRNLNAIESGNRNKLMLNAIDLNDPSVDHLLKSYPCLPSQGCTELQFIKNLVNPSGKVACLYKREEGCFLKETPEDFLSPKRIQRLLDLGMLSDQLPLESIVDRAWKISTVWQEDRSKCQKQIELLLEFMKDSLDNEDSPHWQTLSQTPLLPAVAPFVRQNKDATVLKKPSEVYSDRCSALVSMSEHTVDLSNVQMHQSVLERLGIRTNPSVNTVLQQLQVASRHCGALKHNLLYNITSRCYRYLNERLLEQRHTDAIIEKAKCFPFVLIEGRFVDVRSIARKGAFEEKPYLYLLPVNLHKYEKLWDCVGLQEQFTTEQFLAALEEMKALNGSNPLSTSDLLACASILTKGLYTIRGKAPQDCLLPDERGVLTSSKELKFNDSPWIPISADAKLSHELVPRAVACYFGVTTTRHHTLNTSLVNAFQVSEFGQKEKLTVRIKNIIDAYPSKKDILKELIQNADDAEATEIHFVWDKRDHKKKKIFGENWELFQGPALCVYNNRTFSDADLEGIQQLGEGGKHGTLGRTGKYGLGFNSVYHLTDCPSFLSADQRLCIFDPNLQYIEGSAKLSPGCMLSMNDTFKKSFEDFYHTFLPDMFALDSGTMFRLPLRTEKMAEKSEISKHQVTDLDMNELRSALVEDPEALILFLKHITKVQFSVISKDGKANISFQIEKKYSEQSRASKESFNRYVRQSRTAEERKAFYNVDLVSGEKQSKWIIAESFGLSEQVYEQSSWNNHLNAPQAAVAACCRSSFHDTFTGMAFCSLPLPGKTGLPVHINANFEVDSSRRDLWKEDADSLKTQWNESLKTDIISPLYAGLLGNIGSVIKKDTPTALCFLNVQLDSSYLQYFPCITREVDKVWHEMIHEVYRTIDRRDLALIPTVHAACDELPHQSFQKYTVTWCSPSSTENGPYFTTKDHDGIFEILDHTGMKLVPNSWKMDKMVNGFTSAGVQVAQISPSTVVQFLKQRSLNDPSLTDKSLPLYINETLLKNKARCSQLLTFCLKDATRENINGLPLLLTQEQMLRVFDSKSPKLFSQHFNLFPSFQDRFADIDVNEKHIKILLEGNFLQTVTIDSAAPFLRQELVQLLSNSLSDGSCQLYRTEKHVTEWLTMLWSFFNDQKKSSKDKNRNVFSDIKQNFEHCPILPVICPSQNGTQYLQTMSNISKVIQCPDGKVPSILIKLGFMTLNLHFFHILTPEFRLMHLYPELLQTSNSTAVLRELGHVPNPQFALLHEKECEHLQRFLQDGIRDSREHVHTLKSLPLFETIAGTRQRIDSCRIFILKSDHLVDFPKLYQIEECNSVFLKPSLVNLDLAEFLNIHILNDLEFCEQFVVSSASSMNEEKRLELLRLLVKLQPVGKKIISALKEVRFIKDDHGFLQLASYFYDGHVILYKLMLPKDRFVPDTFWHYFREERSAVLDLLKSLGLKHDVSDEEIIQFARQIESEIKGDTPLETLQKSSKQLFSKVLAKSADKHSDLLRRVAQIKFIFPMKIQGSLCSYHKAFAEEREVVAICGSLLSKDTDHQFLIWTSMPIITVDSSSKHLWSKMIEAGALVSPPPELIAANLKRLSVSLCNTYDSLETRKKVFLKAYAHLQSIEFDDTLFSDLLVILVEDGAVLVKANQATLALEEASEFRPYLYKVPSTCIKYEAFFVKIGVHERPTIHHYSRVLQEVYSDSVDKDTLQANQKITVKRVVQQLFLLLKEEQGKASFPNSPLYLPSIDGRLYESNTLFFNDTAFQTARVEAPLETKLKLLEKLERCHLGKDVYEHQTFLELLPQQVRPRFLSSVISQNLDGAGVQYCDQDECEFHGWFDQHLSSAAFLHGLICLIRHESNGEVPQSEAAQKCDEIFSRIEIICCSTLETELLLQRQSLEGSKTETDVYVKKQSDACVFYLKHNDVRAHKAVNEINMCLMREINALLNNCLSTMSLLALGQLLVCDNMEDVEKILAVSGIHNSAHSAEGRGGLPTPGCLIPEEWHDCLDMNFLNSFESGEYVGFSKDDSGEYFYAIVISRVAEPPEQTTRFPARYNIQAGIDIFTEASSLDLYQFKREKSLQKPDNKCKAMVLLLPSRPSPVFPETLDEVRREIDESLNEIWKMSSEDKPKALKRLYLRWHPDKNPGNEDLATEAFKYLQNRIDELQKGKTVKSSLMTTTDFNFQHFYNTWNREARNHRRGREQFHQNYSRRHYSFWSYHSEPPRPDRQEAKRWFEQARCDLRAAHNDTGGDSSEWCVYKVHQAVEKALKAALLRKQGHYPKNHLILSLALQVSECSSQLASLPTTVRQLIHLGVNCKKTQYPDHHMFPHIPNNQFALEDARRALKIATDLLDAIEHYLT